MDPWLWFKKRKSVKRRRWTTILFFWVWVVWTGTLVLPGWASLAAASSTSEGGQVDHPPPPTITAQAAVLIEAVSGRVLFAKNKDQPMYPASITKIMTGIVALEVGRPDEMVTVSKHARAADGTRVYLAEGEQKPLLDLVYAALVNSGNDAAIAIAEHIAGSEEAFAAMMNEKAHAIGAQHTHFVNASGLHDPQHVTTAYDMALIAQYAMRNPTFRAIVQTKRKPWHGQEWQSELVNHNRLLWEYPGATGVKNGFTSKARFTLVASAERNGVSLISVVMGANSASTLYRETKVLLDYGFAVAPNLPPAPWVLVENSMVTKQKAKSVVRASSAGADEAENDGWKQWVSAVKERIGKWLVGMVLLTLCGVGIGLLVRASLGRLLVRRRRRRMWVSRWGPDSRHFPPRHHL
ncbi:hypothetical protein JCM14720_15750 [Calditerricola yamamurae]